MAMLTRRRTKRRSGAGASVGVGLGTIVAALLLAGLGCSRSAPPASPGEAAIAGHYRSTAAERQRVSVTVYNSNVALVREQRRVRLGTGRVALAYEDVAASLLPATVVLSALDAPSALVVREQNYRYDLLTPEKLLEKYVGRRVSLARYDAVAGKDELREAEVLASSNGPVLRVGGEILTQLPDRISFAELPPGLVPRPTLVWLLDSEREEQSVELSYLTENLSWHADYVLALSPDQQQADLSSWVTLDNRSGASFAGAQLQLVAGDVQRVAPARQEGRHSRLGGRRAGAAPEFKQEKLFEYHLYDLERPTDLLDQEQKQLRLFDAPGIPVQKKLVLRSTNSYSAWQSGSGAGAASEQRPPSVVLELENSEAQGLGMPLPKGVVRVYQRDASGGQQFVGQNPIEHTPRDEKLELEIGRALDVTSERRQLRRMARGKCQLESEWRIELRNAKDQAVVVEVVESMDFASFQLTASSLPAEPRDARTLAFRVPVPARGKAEVSYRVIVTWCG